LRQALKTIYNGAILPQLLYTAPVWREAIKMECNTAKYITVKDNSSPGLEWPRWFQEVKVPRFHDNGTGGW